MNIVHFTTGRINPAAAKVGLVNVIYWLADAQVKAGHRVTVVVLPEKLDYENTREATFAIREYPHALRGGFIVDRQLLSDIDHGTLKIDIAHLHGVWNLEIAAIGAALHKRGIPYVVSSHGSFAPLILRKQMLLKYSFRALRGLPLVNNASFVHLHSENEIKDARSFGVRSATVVAEQGFNAGSIPPKLSSDWLSEKYPEHKDAFKMVFLGRLDPLVKGIDLLLDGFSRALPKIGDDVALFLIGPEKRKYKSKVPGWIAKFGLKNRVIFVGPLYDPAEKFSALASADIFVLTSRFEGFPLTVLEAMACGTPVLVTPGTNASGIINTNDAGIVCSGDAESISRAIIRAVSNPVQLSAMGARGRRVIEGLTWEKTASVLEIGYINAVNGQRA